MAVGHFSAILTNCYAKQLTLGGDVCIRNNRMAGYGIWDK